LDPPKTFDDIGRPGQPGDLYRQCVNRSGCRDADRAKLVQANANQTG
jgi:hypothetical protein